MTVWLFDIYFADKTGQKRRYVGMELKKIKLSDLKCHPKNYNTHPPSQIEELSKSLGLFDQIKNIVVWQGLVIAGNGLFLAAKKKKMKAIEVQDVSDWPEEKAIKFMIADNRLAELGIIDGEMLAGLLKGLDDQLDVPGIDENFMEELNDGDLGKIQKIGDSEKNDNNGKKGISTCPKCGFEYEI